MPVPPKQPPQADNSFAKKSNALNDSFSTSENNENSFLLNVLANDIGGQAKLLWSLDDGGNDVNSDPDDLLAQDDSGSINYSLLGAEISITDDNKVSYALTPELQAKLQDLAIDDYLVDTFIYAMRLGQGNQGPLHWATATVKLTGLNHAPELTGTTAILPEGTSNTDYTISASDLLQGFTDADQDALSVSELTATHGSLTEISGGWVYTPETDFVGTVDLNYTVTDGHGGSLNATQSFTLQTIVDTEGPWLSWSDPWDEFTGFQIDSDITLSFNEAIKAGNGNIVISNGSDTRTISINDANQVTFSSDKYGSNQIIINPTQDLIPNTDYHIQIDAGTITDVAGHAYAGISDDTTLNFTTIPSNPILSWSDPWDDSAEFPIDGDIALHFSETVKAGSSGNIVISNGSDTRTISINDASQVSFDGYNGVIINPSTDLQLNTAYSIKIDNGAITDLAGNTYAGINDDTTLNFTTIDSNPILYGSNPWDDSIEFPIDSDITLFFSEAIKAGSGNIVISNGSDTRTISINDTNQVTFSSDKYGSNQIIINPTQDLIPNTDYHIQIDAGTITDVAGHAYAGISDDTTLNFTTIPSNPILSWSNPWDDSMDFQVDSDIALYFNESVKAGSSGNIVISNGSDTRTISINDASQVSFDGFGGVIINPSADLLPNTAYSIKIDNGAITDLIGHAYAGISDDTTLNFTTIASDPILTWSNPADDSTDFQVDRDISLYFNESIKAGSSGNIVISNGSDTRTISINDASQVSFDGYNGVIINPSTDLLPNTVYSIKIDGDTITDLAGHAYVGISDDTTLNFTTVPSDPILTWSNPLDDSMDFQVDSDITLFFSEAIKAGSGNIVISNGSDTRTISINDANQVTFSSDKYGSNQIIINPTQDLIPNTDYHIQIDAGTITDVAGHAYAGISDDTALNFTTIPSNPILTWSTPWDDATDFQVDSNITLSFNEAIKAGSGNIVISNGSDTRTISINDTDQVSFMWGGKITINPTQDLIPNTDYHIRIDEGAITDLVGNTYAGIQNDTTLNFTTISSNPRLTGSTPADDAIDFEPDQHIVLSFNESVTPGSGNIVISNGTDIRTISINDTDQVTSWGNSEITINPTQDLIPNTTYHIRIDEGAITDGAGNPYEGISDNTTLNFAVIEDTFAPTLISSYPMDDSSLPVYESISLMFDDWVTAGSGHIIISNGTDIREIDVSDASQVSFFDDQVVISPLTALVSDSTYHIEIEAGAIIDTAGNEYAGISDETTLNFTTFDYWGPFITEPFPVFPVGIVEPSNYPLV